MVFSAAFKFLTFVALLLSTTLTPINCLYFNFSEFQNTDRGSLIISDNSNIYLGSIQVTRDARGASIADASGRVLYNRRFGLWTKKGHNAAFNTSFVLNISNQTDPGGEGTAFILTGNQSVPSNSDGQWLGIVNPEVNGSSLSNIVAIEFDTRKSYPEDLDDNHVGLDINSIYSRKQVSLYASNVTLYKGNDVSVRVQYDSQSLTVFVADMKNPVFSVPIDLSAYLPEKVYVGFSGSTSNYTELNCVKSWEFSGVDISKKNLFWVWVVVAVGIVLLLGVCFLYYWHRQYWRPDLEEAYPNIEDEIKGSSTAPKRYKLKELRKAAGKFSPKNELGEGGFGKVYRGTLENREVAIKRFSKEKTQGKQEFIAEVTTIGNLHHRNLVKLIGWCYESREFLLVYEYMPNKSLDKHIFVDKNSDVTLEPLSWERRRNAISGVAQAAEYLHNGCEKRVLHRDIKSSNVMLDSEFSAKLGDFGLARTMAKNQQTHHTTKVVAGTPGYMAPEFIMTAKATIEADIFAFGVLVLEVGCGRRPGGHEEPDNPNLLKWVWELHHRGSLLDAADPRLKGQFKKEEMECLLKLGLACCHPNPNERPSMKAVLQVLSGEALAPEIPSEKPRFMWPPLPSSFNDTGYSLVGPQLAPFSELSGR